MSIGRKHRTPSFNKLFEPSSHRFILLPSECKDPVSPRWALAWDDLPQEGPRNAWKVMRKILPTFKPLRLYGTSPRSEQASEKRLTSRYCMRTRTFFSPIATTKDAGVQTAWTLWKAANCMETPQFSASKLFQSFVCYPLDGYQMPLFEARVQWVQSLMASPFVSLSPRARPQRSMT